MKEERALLLAELLTEMSQDPGGFFPEEAWDVIQRAFALPVIELAVVRDCEEGLQILLVHRDDKDWRGWHVPGGQWRTCQTLEEGIKSLAEAELGTSAVKFL